MQHNNMGDMAQAFMDLHDQAKITQEINAALPLRAAVLLDDWPVIVLETGADQTIAERVATFIAQPGRYSTELLWDHSLGYIVLDVSSGEPEETQFAIRFEWPRDRELLTYALFTGWIGLTADAIGESEIKVLRLTINVEDLAGILQASIIVHQ